MLFLLPAFSLIAVSNAFPGMRSGVRNVVAKEVASSKTSSPLSSRQASTAASNSSYNFQAPQAGDVRSPCPGLNAAANEGICPRNGKGYTVPILIECLAEAYNMGADFSLFVGAAGIGSNPDPLTLSFDLDQLDHHDMVIEHDASLSRADASTGNNYSFNQTIWDTVLAYYAGMDNATIPVAAKAKFMRVTTEAGRDPTFTYTPQQFIFSYGETAIYLSTMGDPVTGVAPLKYVRALFEEERIPYAEGWTKPALPTTLTSLGAMILELNAALGEEVPEGLILGESSLKAALRGLNPITGAVDDPVMQTITSLLGITAST